MVGTRNTKRRTRANAKGTRSFSPAQIIIGRRFPEERSRSPLKVADRTKWNKPNEKVPHWEPNRQKGLRFFLMEQTRTPGLEDTWMNAICWRRVAKANRASRISPRIWNFSFRLNP